LYWFASAENKKIFLDDPESYLQIQLPASTPRLLSFADRQSSLFCQIEDYCPVALVDKKELVKCNGGFIVQYSGKYWNLQNKEACTKFMRRPTRYTQRAKLPNKKPPQKGAQGNNALLAALQKGQSLEIADMLSYLQVSVAEAISTSLVEGGHRRLMYPGKSGKQSALLFLANYLRAHNPLNTQLYRDECQGVLDRFLDDCELPAELSTSVSRRHEAQAREASKETGSAASDGASLAEASEELPGLEPPKPWTFEDERRYEDMCHRFDELFKKKS
jgi:YHS domain-containing protein